MNFYNEIDPFAAAWLRELIKADLIAPGVVDERSIEDITPNELRDYKQCHFFAGIGVWSYALRQAGWPDDRPVWTGSCPCQPFSAAGKRGGTSDERHLWPAFFHLISQSNPRVVFGEQVASQDGLRWFDLVQGDLESASYACWAWDLCAAGFGAPHIRQRLYFVADSQRDGRREERSFVGRIPSGNSPEGFTTRLMSGSADSGMADSDNPRLERRSSMRQRAVELTSRASSLAGGMENSGYESERGMPVEASACLSTNRSQTCIASERSSRSFWSDCEWTPCADGKSRPIEPKSSPLAHGIAHRVGKLRGYGNAIVAPVAQAFIESYLEVEATNAAR